MTHEQNVWTLFVDGASRKNPGPSGAGIYIEKDGIAVIKEGFYLGIKTNNQAEYLALLLGLCIIQEHMKSSDVLHVISDSQLLVRQLTGAYKVKHMHLLPLYHACKEKMNILHATITHIMREGNTQADAMANHGIDCKKNPPKNYLSSLKHYDINI